MAYFHKTLKLLTSNQTVKRIDKNILLIGVKQSFITKFEKMEPYLEGIKLFKPTFSTFLEPKQKVNSYEVIGHLYDNILINQYLFYSPYKGEILCRNEYLLQNIEKMYNNDKNDNWLVQIKIEDPNKNYSGYY